ncbi:hypothetical protein GBA52_026153, partial [Prunus armeniaca]
MDCDHFPAKLEVGTGHMPYADCPMYDFQVASPQGLFSSVGIWDPPLCVRSAKKSRKLSNTYCYTASPPLTSGCSVRL